MVDLVSIATIAEQPTQKAHQQLSAASRATLDVAAVAFMVDVVKAANMHAAIMALVFVGVTLRHVRQTVERGGVGI